MSPPYYAFGTLWTVVAYSFRCLKSCVTKIQFLIFFIESPENIKLLDGSKSRILKLCTVLLACSRLYNATTVNRRKVHELHSLLFIK